MTTPNRMQEYWTQVLPFLHEQWPRLTQTDLEEINGDFDVLLKKIKEYYNNFPIEEIRARDRLQAFLNQLEGV